MKLMKTALCCHAALLALVLAPAASSDAAATVDGVEPLWHVATPPEARHVAADGNGSVVTAFRGEVWATDTIGGPTWQVKVTTGEEIVPDAPAIGESLVVVPVDGRRVVALDRATGAERWQQAAEVLAVGVGDSPSGPVAALATRSTVELRAGADGSTMWSTAQVLSADQVAASPQVSVDSGRVLVSWADNVSHIRALDVTNGALVWQHDEPRWETAPTVHDGSVFLAVNRGRAKRRKTLISAALRLDLQTGAVAWEQPMHGGFLPTFAPAVDGSTVALVDFDGRVTALEARSGDVRWRRSTARQQFENKPLIAGKVFAMTTYGTGLVALSGEDGTPVPNEVPGPAEGWAVIRDSAASGQQLYLLAKRTNLPGDAEGELWMLPTGPEGYIPPTGWTP